jgi:diadenylate cyclase
VFETICKMTPGCQPEVLEHTIQLAVEIAREGRAGHKIGAIFILCDEEAVLNQSRSLILDPLQGHPPELKKISDFNMRETAKELAQLDGAFIVSADGTILSAARYLSWHVNVQTRPKRQLPMIDRHVGRRHTAVEHDPAPHVGV